MNCVLLTQAGFGMPKLPECTITATTVTLSFPSRHEAFRVCCVQHNLVLHLLPLLQPHVHARRNSWLYASFEARPVGKGGNMHNPVHFHSLGASKTTRKLCNFLQRATRIPEILVQMCSLGVLLTTLQSFVSLSMWHGNWITIKGRLHRRLLRPCRPWLGCAPVLPAIRPEKARTQEAEAAPGEASAVVTGKGALSGLRLCMATTLTVTTARTGMVAPAEQVVPETPESEVAVGGSAQTHMRLCRMVM